MEIEKKVEPKKRNTPRFIHFGWYGQTMLPGKHKHDGVLTVAFRQRTESELNVGFVFCSPSDNFSRKEGRNDALKFMRNHPILLPVKPNKSNRELVMEFVHWLCGITPPKEGWVIPQTALYNCHDTFEPEKWTSRIPGWSKKWWKGIFVKGKPIGRQQTPSKNTCTPIWKPLNIFDMPMGQFFKQAQEAGIAVDIMLG